MAEFINDIFKISAMCSGVILILILVRKIVGKKTGAWWRSIVWLLLLIRLCLPISIDSSISIFKQDRVEAVTNYVRPVVHIPYEADTEKNDISNKEINEITDSKIIANNTEELSDIENISYTDTFAKETSIKKEDTHKPINWLRLAHYGYICGFVAAFVYLIARMINLTISLKRYERCKDERMLKILSKVKSDMRIKRRVDILVDNNKSVPALCGVFFPKLILPRSTIQSMTDKQLEYVFIHELTHLKRRDVLKLWTIEFVLCIHWFNPIIYIARPLIRQDIELACDERIIMHLQDDNFIDYCNVLMMSSIKKYRPIPGVITANLTGKSGKKLKERLTMINNFNKKKVLISGIVLVMTLIFILVACTTKATKVEKVDKVDKSGMHLGVTVEEMQSKIEMLAEEYTKLKKQYDENPDKFDNGMYISNYYSAIEVSDKPNVSKNENDLTKYEYTILNNKILNNNYEVKEYKYDDEMVDNKALRLIYLMSEDEKYIKEITIRYDYNLDNKENSRGYQMFNTIVKQAFIMAKENDNTFIDCRCENRITEHSLYTTGRAYDNSVMYCYNCDSNIHTNSITPVYNPDMPIFKTRDDSLGIKPNEVNDYIKDQVIGFIDYFKKEIDNNVEPERAKNDLALFKNIDLGFSQTKKEDNSSNVTLQYTLYKNAQGENVIDIIYTLDKAQKYLSQIDLLYNKSYENEETKKIHEFLDKLIRESVISLKMNFNSPTQEDLGAGPNGGIAFKGTVKCEIKNEKNIFTTTIKHIHKAQEVNTPVSHLGITPSLINDNITYLLQNKWLDTKLEFSDENATELEENGKTIIKYSIAKSDNKDSVTLSYTLAKDDKHIESITASNHIFFNRGENQELYIDLNLILNKAYLLAVDGNKDLKGSPKDKPIYINDLRGDVIEGCIMDSERNTYTTVIKTSLEADEVLQPIKDNFVKHYPALAVTSDEINEKIQYLLDIKWIDTELEFDSKLTAVENKYNLKTIKEFRVLSNKNGNSILSLYYSLFDEYVDSVGVTYNSYLGDEKTDMMYKDLCMIADRACSMARGEDTEENSSKVSYRPKSLSKWDYDGRVTPFEAVDHQVFFTLIEGEDKWMCKNLPSIEVDERHPHLGITPQVMNKNLLLLSKDAEFMDFNSSIKRDDDGTYYQYVFEESKGGKPVISLLLLLTNDGKYIRAIQVSYSKESKLYNAELRTKFKKLRKMTDIAFVMAKDDINSYNDFSSTNYPLPEPAKALGEIIPVSKAYDNTVYIMEGEDESFVEYWIDTANAQKEYSYLTDYFKIN